MDVSVLVAAEESLKTKTPIAKFMFWNVAILRESFAGENFHKFHGFGAIHKSLNLNFFEYVSVFTVNGRVIVVSHKLLTFNWENPTFSNLRIISPAKDSRCMVLYSCNPCEFLQYFL